MLDNNQLLRFTTAGSVDDGVEIITLDGAVPLFHTVVTPVAGPDVFPPQGNQLGFQPLVLDHPQCGVHILEGVALGAQAPGDTHYFHCSSFLG